MMKLVKSECGKAWLFDVRKEDNTVSVGFACFLPQCGMRLSIDFEGNCVEVLTPSRAINVPMPIRIINARLSVLS